MEDIGKTFESLVYLTVTTIPGIAVQALIVYPTIYLTYACVRKTLFDISSIYRQLFTQLLEQVPGNVESDFEQWIECIACSIISFKLFTKSY